VIVAEYVIFYQINTFFVSTKNYFFTIDKMASRAASGPRAVVWRPWPTVIHSKHDTRVSKLPAAAQVSQSYLELLLNTFIIFVKTAKNIISA